MTTLNAPIAPTPPLATRRSRLKLIGWGLVQAWLVFHLLAIVISPAAVEPASRLELGTRNFFAPYAETLFLNHGYHYFAPEPGESALLGYELKFADGRLVKGRLPHKEIQPRLLYHRHFMLTEYLPAIVEMEPALKRAALESYARQLRKQHGAVSVRLFRVSHGLASMERIRAGGSLNDAESFTEVLLGEFDDTSSQLIESPTPPNPANRT